MKKHKLVASLIGIISIGFLIYLYDWKLVLILLGMKLSHNLSKHTSIFSETLDTYLKQKEVEREVKKATFAERLQQKEDKRQTENLKNFMNKD
jgi:ABC-type bacteriocin/lantibiotic exporter with double-glycine peptidase domain